MGRQPDAGRRYGAELIRSLLVDQVLAGAPLRRELEPIDPRITKVLSYIAHHPADPLNVEYLAAFAGLSVSRFRVLFRDATGASPKRYVRDQRLSKARTLLTREPELTIQQVAERTGFNDAHYMHQVFREQVGQTPSDFRADILGE
jgi:transcriptional regulator GlxA family with amidase domain